MSQRTFTLTATVVDATNTPVPNAPCTVAILSPTATPAVDGNGAIVETLAVACTTNASGQLVQLDGTSAVLVDYPGDYQTPYVNARVLVTLNGIAILSPVGFAYAASIDASSWIVAPSTAGLVTMRVVYTNDADQGVPGVVCSVALSQPAVVVASGQIAAGSSQPVQALTGADGTATFSLNPNSLLNPSNLNYQLTIAGEQQPFFFTVPAVVDVYKGAYNAGTTYHGASGSSNGDVVLSGGVLYRAVAPTTGNAPPNATYWQVVTGLPTDLITAHLVATAQVGTIVIGPANIAASTDLVAVTGDPVNPAVTLDDDLIDLAWRDTQRLRYLGAWSSGTAYVANDVALLGGIDYICILAHTNHSPPNVTYWVPIGGSSGGGGNTSVVPAPRARYWPQAISPGAPSAVVGTVTLTADGSYSAFPGIAVDRHGAILVCYRRGTAHTQTGSSSFVYKKSTDGGATWSGETAIVTMDASHDLRDASLLVTATGRLLAVYDDTPNGGTTSATGVLYSDDDGASWSSVTTIGAFTSNTNAPSRPLQHSSGAIILPLFGKNSGDTDWRLGVVISTDDGATWSSLITIGAANSGYNEFSLVELPDHPRTIKAFIRKDTGSEPTNIYVATSADTGNTWTSPTALSFNVTSGRPGAVLVPTSQELILTYRGYPTISTAYRYSTDFGATFSGEVVLDSGGDANGSMYAAVVALADQLVGVAWSTEIGASQANIYFTSLAVGTGGVGTVSSVALTVPSRQTVTGSPITGAGTLAITDNAQAQGTFLGGPTTGAPSTPAYRTLVPTDLPIASTAARGAVIPDGSSITVTAGGVISASASGSTLASLGDANISGLHDEDVLIYRTSDNKWHNVDPTAAGGGALYWAPLTDVAGNLIVDANGSCIMVPAAV